MALRRAACHILLSALLVCIAAGVTSCSTTALYNVFAATSDYVQGVGLPTPRAIQVGFINNTSFRAVFTYGAYDQYNQETIPTNFGQLRLEGHASSAQVRQPCRQSFSVGGSDLIRLIQDNEADPSINVTDDRALVRGVYFSGAPLGDPLEAEPTEGTAEGVVVLSGVDFTCERTDIRDTTGTGLLLFTFEQDAQAPGGFRIDYSFVEP
ncbi:MAG: hypothetical protein JXQ75_23020 [Phycisphaerae bacterium]|nr:hypothetical protein [Phycisphaerae bacterium]